MTPRGSQLLARLVLILVTACGGSSDRPTPDASNLLAVTVRVQVPETTPAGAKIYITGNFQSWDPGAAAYQLSLVGERTYEIQLAFAPGTQLEFNITRGSWETVERGSCVTYETEAVSRDGIVRPLEARVCPASLGGDRLVIDVARDITERREAESAIRRLAYTDHLTGLPNRVLLFDRAQLALARTRRSGERQALLFMDLDNLKRVNDSLGHAAGDELLRQVGERLAATFRGEDTVARIGGDEFVVFVRVSDAADAEAVAGRVIELIDAPFVVGGDEIYSSASIGVAVAPEDGTDLDELIAKADAAMYVAKEQGRNRYRLHGEPR